MPFLDTRYGRLAVPGCNDDLVSRFLLRYGEWAWLETLFVASILPDQARVLDGGAYIGTFALGLAELRQLGFLCCVEANPASASILQANIEAHVTVPHVVVEALLAAPLPGVRRSMSETGNLGATSFVVDGAEDGAGHPGPSLRSLADLRHEHGAFDLIKLDIEGMELEVLRDAGASLADGKTTLWLECNETPASVEVAELLLSWGLPLYYFSFPAHNPANMRGDPDAIFPWAFEAGLLAAPAAIPGLTPELKAAGCCLIAVADADTLREAMWRTPRWGRREWEHAGSKAELAALVGRSLTDATLDDFPSTRARHGTLWERLDAAQTAASELGEMLETERRQQREVALAFQEARQLALERLDEAVVLRRQLVDTEQGLATAQDLAWQRMAQLDQMRARLDEVEALAASRLDELIRERRETLRLDRELAASAARGLRHLATLGAARDDAAHLEARHEAARLELQREAARREARLEAAHQDRVAALTADATARLLVARADSELQVSVLAQRAGYAEQALVTFQSSTTWRMTLPLRRAVALAKRSAARLSQSR